MLWHPPLSTSLGVFGESFFFLSGQAYIYEWYLAFEKSMEIFSYVWKISLYVRITHNTSARRWRSLLLAILYLSVVVFSHLYWDNSSGCKKVSRAVNPPLDNSTMPWPSSHKVCAAQDTEHLFVGCCVPSETDNTRCLLNEIFYNLSVIKFATFTSYIICSPSWTEYIDVCAPVCPAVLANTYSKFLLAQLVVLRGGGTSLDKKT